MKLSQVLALNVTQHEIDFIDIDISNDTPLFIDPHFIATRQDAWSHEATSCIRSFFGYLLTLIRADNREQALEIFMGLKEPNETRLGLSRGRSQGRGVGPDDARKIFESLLTSRAVQTGLVEDIEDCRLFIEGIDKDKTSDMATNIIRRQLIAYTQKQCKLWDIPLTQDVPSGLLWNKTERCWEENHTEMLVIDGNKLLLVPKGIVSFNLAYTPQCYHQHFVLNFLQSHHLRINSALAQQRRNRRTGAVTRFVTKKSLIETEAAFSKSYLTTFTLSHPEVFRTFKGSSRSTSNSLESAQLSEDSVSEVIDRIIQKLNETPPGNEHASTYHRTITAALELIFYPRLSAPEIEQRINEGRKRIDICFDNAATTGFFQRIHSIYQTPSQFIMVECKNYGRELANPELDQMIGRFSPNRGKFGLIVCRSLENKQLFTRRCADTYRDGHGIIISLTDEDIIGMLTSLRAGTSHPEDIFLADKFRQIALH
jgi:hypothetical protein